MLTFKSFLSESRKPHSRPLIRRVKARVRAGKIQRNVKVAGKKGYRISKGRLVRMSMAERMHRRRGARRARIKRRIKMLRILVKRRRSLRRRGAIGIK